MIKIYEKKNKINNKRWLSPSSINAYLSCPRRYYFSKIAKRKQKPNIHLIRGNIVHLAVQNFFRYKIHQCGNLDYSEVRKITLDLLKDEWSSSEQSMKRLGLSDADLVFYYHDSQKMMLNFLHDFIKDDGFSKPGPQVEKTFFCKELKIMGRIDAIHEGRGPPLLIDLKTSKSKELTKEYKRQLGIYALLYKEKFNTLPLVGIHFLKFKNGLQKYRLSEKFVKNIRDLIIDIHKKTVSDNIKDYPCACGWCDKNFRMKRSNHGSNR